MVSGVGDKGALVKVAPVKVALTMSPSTSLSTILVGVGLASGGILSSVVSLFYGDDLSILEAEGRSTM